MSVKVPSLEKGLVEDLGYLLRRERYFSVVHICHVFANWYLYPLVSTVLHLGRYSCNFPREGAIGSDARNQLLDDYE